MQPDIFDFLEKLDKEVTSMGRLDELMQQEIKTYQNILDVLKANQQAGSDDTNLATIEVYLQHLQLVALKLKSTYLALLHQTELEIETELNRQILRILKKLNSL
jgi:hypothetical protein